MVCTRVTEYNELLVALLAEREQLKVSNCTLCVYCILALLQRVIFSCSHTVCVLCMTLTQSVVVFL